jgi:hypothetical protein
MFDELGSRVISETPRSQNGAKAVTINESLRQRRAGICSKNPNLRGNLSVTWQIKNSQNTRSLKFSDFR